MFWEVIISLWSVIVNDKRVFTHENRGLAEHVMDLLHDSGYPSNLRLTQSGDNIPVQKRTFSRLMKLIYDFNMEIADEELAPIIAGLPKPPSMQRSKRFLGEPSDVPPLRVRRNLLASSKAKRFNDAQKEWEFRGEILEETSPDFSNCQLCNQSRLLTNCIIHNIHDQKIFLKVGPVCVRRFVWINSARTLEESQEIFDSLYDQGLYVKNYKRLIPSLADEEISESILLKLIELCKSYFKENYSQEKYHELVNLLNIKGTDIETKLEYIASGDLGKLKRLIRIRKIHDKVPDYWGKLRTRVTTTLSRSEAYRIK